MVAHLRLGEIAHGEEGPGEVFLAKAEEEVALVLVAVAASLEHHPAVVPLDAGVVARRHRRGARGVHQVPEVAPLEVVVAEDAGAGSAAGEVLPHEGTHHLVLEPLLVVDDVVGNAEVVGHEAGVVQVVEGATARCGTGAADVPELHRHADALVPRFHQKQGGDGGVDPSAHGYNDTHLKKGSSLSFAHLAFQRIGLQTDRGLNAQMTDLTPFFRDGL